MSDFDFDPYDPASFEDPYPSYVTMRNEYPVYRREIPNYQVFRTTGCSAAPKT